MRVLLLTCLILGCTTRNSEKRVVCRTSSNYPSADQQAEDLFLIHIDEINFSNISIKDAVHELSKATRFCFVLMSPGYPASSEPYAVHEDPFSDDIPSSEKFNFKARDIRLSDALNEICEKADCFWRLTDVAIIIYRKNIRHSFQREIAFSHFNPNERDKRVSVLSKTVVPDVRLYNSSPVNALNSLIESTQISCCFLGAHESDGDPALSTITLSGKNIPLLDCIDVLCTAADSYWMASGTNEVLCIPSNRLNAGYVHVLPNVVSKTVPPRNRAQKGTADCPQQDCESHEPFVYTQEIVWEGYSPVLRQNLISMLNNEKIRHVSFTNMPTREAIRWLSGQHSQSIGICSNEAIDEGALGVVNLTMTNATFFSVLDRICQQNELRWGFTENILLVYTMPFLNSNSGWTNLYNGTHSDSPR